MEPAEHRKIKIKQIVREALMHRGFSEGETEQLINRLIRFGESADDKKYATLPFGKYKGWALDDVPTEYLSWLMGQTWFREKFPAFYEDILEVL